MNNNEENKKEIQKGKNDQSKKTELKEKENITNSPTFSNIADSLGIPSDATDFSNRLGINPDLLTDALKPNIYIPQVLNNFPDYKDTLNVFKVGFSLFSDKIKQQNEKFANILAEPLQQLTNLQKELADFINKQINIIPPVFNSLSYILEELKPNPDSVLSWQNYYDTLTEYFWIFPYKITYDKTQTKRRYIFEPIIDDLNSKNENSQLLFIVMMLNSNINLLYKRFTNKDSIHTQKNMKACFCPW